MSRRAEEKTPVRLGEISQSASVLSRDAVLEGGVAPTIRVPVTADTVRAQFKDGRDAVLETAVRTLSANPRE